jgi:hypothetical protein
MAVKPRDVGLTREDVWLWLKAYDGQVRDTKKLRAYLQQKVTDAELPDEEIDVSDRTDIDGKKMYVVDMIMLDLESYK